jgi:ACT domain-containing protein
VTVVLVGWIVVVDVVETVVVLTVVAGKTVVVVDVDVVVEEVAGATTSAFLLPQATRASRAMSMTTNPTSVRLKDFLLC